MMKRIITLLGTIAAVALLPLTWLVNRQVAEARAAGYQEDWLKRAFDVTVASALFVAILPLFAVLALAIKLDSNGPIFYKATRAGRGGQPFKLYKFRSMVVDADKQGPGITTSGDSRVTRTGRLLRRTKLDELPQLINVINGDMSLVGPRPEDLRYVALYTPEQRAVLDVRPGITGLASVHYRNEEAILVGDDWETTYINEVMPAKLNYDLAYAQDANVFKDIVILGQTARALFE
jgi:lipopolysaccharide/colanic/teichoic acid biosynthesis glycosyltransferase